MKLLICLLWHRSNHFHTGHKRDGRWYWKSWCEICGRRWGNGREKNMNSAKLSDPWTEHPALVKAEAGIEIARLRALNAELMAALQAAIDVISDNDGSSLAFLAELTDVLAKARGET